MSNSNFPRSAVMALLAGFVLVWLLLSTERGSHASKQLSYLTEVVVKWKNVMSRCDPEIQRELACYCIPDFDRKKWLLQIEFCGLNATLDNLRKAAIDIRFDSISAEFRERFLRAIIFAYPDIRASLGLSESDGNIGKDEGLQIFHSRFNMEDANSGHCWFFEQNRVFKCLPSLVIIGFQRAATRELYEWLACREDLQGLRPRFSRETGNEVASVETHYFDSLPESGPFHELQPLRRKDALGSLEETWATEYLEESPSLSLEQVLNNQLIFEKTPAYADETDPILIRKLLPHVHLIAMLREPGQRLYSAYWRRCYAIRSKVCSVENFKESILSPSELCGLFSNPIRKDEELEAAFERCKNVFLSGFDLRAVLVGFYEVYLYRYLRAFRDTKASMLVIFAESFASSPFPIMDEVEVFLGLSHFNYTSKAALDAKTGMYVVSDRSKALRGNKALGYVPYNNLPPDVSEKLSKLYALSIKSLRGFVGNNMGNSFFKWSQHRNAWLL